MRILLDECVPKRFGRFLSDHDVTTAPQAGWAGIKNGELLRRASEAFDVFITVDRNLAFQQRASNLPLPVIVLHAQSNKLRDLEPHIPALQRSLSSALANDIYHLGGLRVVSDS